MAIIKTSHTLNTTGFRGGAYLDDNLPDIIDNLPERADEMLMAIAEITASYAQIQAPVAEQDPRTIPGQPGDMKKSIKGGKHRTPEGERIGVLIAWYWFFVEFGTRYQSPHPFMRPALELATKQVWEIARASFADLQAG